jgi:hypothetical protein
MQPHSCICHVQHAFLSLLRLGGGRESVAIVVWSELSSIFQIYSGHPQNILEVTYFLRGTSMHLELEHLAISIAADEGSARFNSRRYFVQACKHARNDAGQPESLECCTLDVGLCFRLPTVGGLGGG